MKVLSSQNIPHPYFVAVFHIVCDISEKEV